MVTLPSISGPSKLFFTGTDHGYKVISNCFLVFFKALLEGKFIMWSSFLISRRWIVSYKHTLRKITANIFPKTASTALPQSSSDSMYPCVIFKTLPSSQSHAETHSVGPPFASTQTQQKCSLSPNCFRSICSSCWASAKETTGVSQQPGRGGPAELKGRKLGGAEGSGARGRLTSVGMDWKWRPRNRKWGRKDISH